MTQRPGHPRTRTPTLHVDAIRIVRARPAAAMGDIDALADAIAADGLRCPPVLGPERQLIKGTRRVAAMRKLGWTDIPVHHARHRHGAIIEILRQKNLTRDVPIIPGRARMTIVDTVALFDLIGAIPTSEQAHPRRFDWRVETANALGLSYATLRQFLSLVRDFNGAPHDRLRNAAGAAIAEIDAALLATGRGLAALYAEWHQRRRIIAADLSDEVRDRLADVDRPRNGPNGTSTHISVTSEVTSEGDQRRLLGRSSHLVGVATGLAGIVAVHPNITVSEAARAADDMALVRRTLGILERKLRKHVAA